MEIFPSYDPQKYIRVLKLATKPTNEELKMTSAVAGIFISLAGLLGFIIYTVMSFIPA